MRRRIGQVRAECGFNNCLEASDGNDAPRCEPRKLRLRIGESSGVELELFHAAYDVIRTGTACEHATLEIVPSPVIWECAACGSAVDPGRGLWCPTCHRPAELVSGDEIILEQIELEVA